MNHIGDLIKQKPLLKRQSESVNLQIEPPQILQACISQSEIDKLFKKLITIYNHTFTSRYGLVDSEGVWQQALKKLTQEQLSSGIKALLEDETPFSTYPPNPIEFRNLCKGDEKVEQSFTKMEPIVPCDPIIARKYLNEISYLIGRRIKRENVS